MGSGWRRGLHFGLRHTVERGGLGAGGLGSGWRRGLRSRLEWDGQRGGVGDGVLV